MWQLPLPFIELIIALVAVRQSHKESHFQPTLRQAVQNFCQMLYAEILEVFLHTAFNVASRDGYPKGLMGRAICRHTALRRLWRHRVPCDDVTSSITT